MSDLCWSSKKIQSIAWDASTCHKTVRRIRRARVVARIARPGPAPDPAQQSQPAAAARASSGSPARAHSQSGSTLMYHRLSVR